MIKLKFLLTVLFFTGLIACTQINDEERNINAGGKAIDTLNIKKQIASMLDSFNVAAANAEYEKYFNYFTSDAVFIGTDASEYWDKRSYMVWAKPFFDKKKTWDFKSFDRHIYPGGADIAWFDELLETPFALLCRGSGVVVRQNNEWKIQHYVLSMIIPNNISNKVREMKTTVDDSILNSLKNK